MKSINACHEINDPKSSTASEPLTTASGDPCQEYPAGTSSISSHPFKKSTSKNIVSGKKGSFPATVFRSDYQKHVRISYLEAADYAGVSVKTIQKWICSKKYRVILCGRIGPFRIDFLELKKFIRNGR